MKPTGGNQIVGLRMIEGVTENYSVYPPLAQIFQCPLHHLQRALHKWTIFIEVYLISYTSSRAAKRRGDPESLDSFVGACPELAEGLLATTGYAKVS